MMIKKLAKYPGGASALLGDAKGIHERRHISVARCVAEQVIETYNSGRRSGKLDLQSVAAQPPAKKATAKKVVA